MKVVVILDGKALETSLIQMPSSGGAVVGVVSHRMCAANPLAKSPQFSSDQRANNQVPMIGHDLVRKQFHSVKLQRFRQHLFKRQKVTLFQKHRGSHIGAIQGMINPACFVSSR